MSVLTVFVFAANLAASVPMSDPASWSAEKRARIERIVKSSSAVRAPTTARSQEEQRRQGRPVVKAVGFPVLPTRYLDQDEYGCVIVAFDILPDGRTDQFEVVEADPPGVFDELALRMALLTEFEPLSATAGPRPRHQKAMFVPLQTPVREHTMIKSRSEEELDRRRVQARADCEARAP